MRLTVYIDRDDAHTTSTVECVGRSSTGAPVPGAAKGAAAAAVAAAAAGGGLGGFDRVAVLDFFLGGCSPSGKCARMRLQSTQGEDIVQRAELESDLRIWSRKTSEQRWQ